MERVTRERNRRKGERRWEERGGQVLLGEQWPASSGGEGCSCSDRAWEVLQHHTTVWIVVCVHSGRRPHAHVWNAESPLLRCCTLEVSRSHLSLQASGAPSAVGRRELKTRCTSTPLCTMWSSFPAHTAVVDVGDDRGLYQQLGGVLPQEHPKAATYCIFHLKWRKS